MEEFNLYIKSLDKRIKVLEKKETKETKEQESISIIEVVNTDIVWEDKWNNPYREMMKARTPDIYDILTQYRGGDGKCWIENGIMNLSGRQPRLYINLDIQNVEVSVDYKRIGNNGKKWSGATLSVRSHPEGHSKEPEKAHTYYFRMKHENRIDFYREIDHGTGGGTGDRKIIHIKKYKWVPNKWYNIKFRCFNIGNDTVKLEGFIDNKLVLEFKDKNKKMSDAKGCVFIRNSYIEQAQYKNMKIKIIKK